MFRALVFLLLPAMASAEVSLRQYHAETSTSHTEILSTLTPLLPNEVTVTDTGTSAMISYTGQMTPRPLAEFVASAFVRFDPAVMDPANPVSLSLSLLPQDNGTALVLMLQADFDDEIVPIPLPAAGSTLVDGAQEKYCLGQSVISYPSDMGRTAQAYGAYLESAGFAVQADPSAPTSFFIGYSSGCIALLYLTPESDSETIVVIRFEEE